LTTEPSSDFELEIDPVWDPLLGDLRFEKIVASRPKETKW
jgi:hypothetical protein